MNIATYTILIGPNHDMEELESSSSSPSQSRHSFSQAPQPVLLFKDCAHQREKGLILPI
jgi:hypothetical protein